ncbi:hypothetical protein Ocin01_05374 [Orchesella cincta]|uniref:Uncharacterized protein n=1 Tax=Orchesella cincta TaxID=48709 RepID=A0A1D2N8K5_ORCCI|nr:hypothetical protein Ocin01_05374 [Orchesella cincta]
MAKYPVSFFVVDVVIQVVPLCSRLLHQCCCQDREKSTLKLKNVDGKTEGKLDYDPVSSPASYSNLLNI